MKCEFPEDGVPESIVYDAEVRDDSVYTFECRHGHQNVVVVQEDKFELLFEIGLNAIVDGYYREAVSSITSSLERFYEFYIRVSAQKQAISAEQFKTAWKTIKNHSERQLGAFVVAHLLCTGVSPTLLDTKVVEFRNNVIHKGKIPLRAEAVDYANTVLQLITPTLVQMKETLGPEIQAVVMERIKCLHDGLNTKLQRTLMSIGSTVSVSLAVTEQHPTTIKDRLEKLEERKYKYRA